MYMERFFKLTSRTQWLGWCGLAAVSEAAALFRLFTVFAAAGAW
jgi:hypothetical protein